MIEVKHLTKKYGERTAVSDLSFSIEKGQVYGLLGPNGAGKSTTMNIMTGCLAATSGDVKIGGYDIFEQANEAKKLIGYLPEIPPLYTERTPREYLTFVARAKGIAATELSKELEYVMEVTQITDVADRLIKNLSKGYKQRVGIAQALLGNPEVIILDEPTVGLDPKQIIEIRDLIQNLAKEHTVILSSHILSEIRAVCNTILIISKGKLVACDTPENLEKQFSGTATIHLTVEANQLECMKILGNVSHIANLDIQENAKENEKQNLCDVTIETDVPDGDSVCREIFFAFCDERKAILRMNMDKVSLEDIFIELTSGESGAEEDIEDAKDNAQKETATKAIDEEISDKGGEE